jgi:hypothetical protein
MTKITINGQQFDIDAARNLMDDELCESIHGTVETEIVASLNDRAAEPKTSQRSATGSDASTEPECRSSPNGRHSELLNVGTFGWCEWCSEQVTAHKPAVDEAKCPWPGCPHGSDCVHAHKPQSVTDNGVVVN